MPYPDKRKPRSYPQSALIAVIAVYLPGVLPLLVGPALGGGHGVEQYLKLLVIGPGVAVGVYAPYGQATVVMVIVTVLLLLFMTFVARTFRGLELAVIYSPTIALLGLLYYALGVMLT